MIRRLAQIELAVAVSLLAIIVALVFSAAVMRFFGRPLIWSVDVAQLLFIWLCFLGATRAMREKAHIGIDLFVRLLGHRARLAGEIAVSLVVLAFLALLAVEGYRLTLLNRQRLFGDSGLSYAFVTAAVPVGSLMLAVALLYNLAGAWRRRRDHRTLVYSRSEPGSVTETEL